MSSRVTNEWDLLRSDELLAISKDVTYYRNKFQVNRIIRDDIFKILEQEARVLYYPIQNDEICAFFREVNKKKFVFINTAIPYEKQVFAAAHELAHVWSSQTRNSEILLQTHLNEYISNPNGVSSTTPSNRVEHIANRFAAEFLVEKRVLEEEIGKIDIPKMDDGDFSERFVLSLIKGILTLMDQFLVPYKTIVRRLYEINHIDRSLCEQLLSVEARDKKSPIRALQQRFLLCEKNNFISKRKKLDNYLDLALTSYENKLRTYEKLEELLVLVGKNPTMFDIYPVKEERLSEEELDAYLADDE